MCTHVHTETRDKLRCCPQKGCPLGYFETGSQEPGAHQIGWATAYPKMKQAYNPTPHFLLFLLCMLPPVTPTLGYKCGPPTFFVFVLFFYGFWELNAGPHTLKASPLPVALILQSQLLLFLLLYTIRFIMESYGQYGPLILQDLCNFSF